LTCSGFRLRFETTYLFFYLLVLWPQLSTHLGKHVWKIYLLLSFKIYYWSHMI